MKKVLACLLVLTMVLGSFSVAFAGSYSDVADNASYAQAVEVLTSLGLVSGDGDGTYRPTDAVKRSEMAKLIVVALGYGDFAAAQKATKFSDVPASHWASGYISFASDLGIIEGVGAGKFNPDVTV
ncbi:MAG: S-layer homology domain-containing protein, partial [Clostridiales bacterium]|nr:S-layer homology domain-containing protein [Clostridiales bacterium]